MNQPLKTSFVEKLRAQTEQAEDEGKYFGFDRQENGRALMFELRTCDGRRNAYPYSYMTRTEFDPNGGIVIFASSAVIEIKGRGLETIFTYLLQNRLTWVKEDSSGMDTDDEAVFVEGIEVKRYDEAGK